MPRFPEAILSWMSHSRVRAGSALLAFLLGSLGSPPSVRAQEASAYWFVGTKLILERATDVHGELAVSTRDAGFERFLAKLGATLAFAPGQKYAIVTAADRRTITFTIGDAQIVSGGVATRAPFAPYLEADDLYVPFVAVARALYVEPVKSGSEIVLQPQLGGLDVRTEARKTTLTFRGAVPLRYTKIAETPDRVTIAFPGVASTLTQARRMSGGAVSEVDVLVSGNPKNPTTTVTIEGVAGVAHGLAVVPSTNEFSLTFGPSGTVLGAAIPETYTPPAGSSVPIVAQVVPTPSRTPRPPPTPIAPATYAPNDNAAPAATLPPDAIANGNSGVVPSTSGAPTSITDVGVDTLGDGVTVRISASGPVSYEWHRLADNRWYIDFKNAVLTGSGRDERPNAIAVDSVRARQAAVSPVPIVRIALSLKGERRVAIVPLDGGLWLAIDGSAATDTARVGTGAIGTPSLAPATGFGTPYPGETLAPGVSAYPTPYATTTPWKYGTPPNGSKLIVIDPGHGGSDSGALGNGLVEKTLTLDIEQRLKALLVAQGWTVRMTRERDVDVARANAADAEELQARVDVANLQNARLFISVHINSFPTQQLNGTMTFYTKGIDKPLADAVQRDLIPLLGTKDDGVRAGRLYVTRRTTMPAILVETGFISNAGDAALMRSSEFLQNVAQGIANGVRDYARAQPATASLAGER